MWEFIFFEKLKNVYKHDTYSSPEIEYGRLFKGV